MPLGRILGIILIYLCGNNFYLNKYKVCLILNGEKKYDNIQHSFHMFVEIGFFLSVIYFPNLLWILPNLKILQIVFSKKIKYNK